MNFTLGEREDFHKGKSNVNIKILPMGSFSVAFCCHDSKLQIVNTGGVQMIMQMKNKT